MAYSKQPDNNETGGLSAFDSTSAAPEFTPIPPGIYSARVIQGAVCQTKTGTDAYRMRFEIIDGPEKDRTVSRMWVFTPKAIAYAKRDLEPFGLTSQKALLSQYPPDGKEIVCRLTVAIQKGEDGIERNDIKRIDKITVRESPSAAFKLDSEDD